MKTKKQLLEEKAKIEKQLEALEEKGGKGYVIKNRYNDLEVYVSTKDNVRDAVIEAVEKGAGLWGADLSEADLRGADLREAKLGGANLREADLGEANLGEANLGGANLGGANLREADLGGADLGGANLWKADLRGADLRGANLWEAKLYGKGGTSKLKKNQVEDFLNALGFQIED